VASLAELVLRGQSLAIASVPTVAAAATSSGSSSITKPYQASCGSLRGLEP